MGREPSKNWRTPLYAASTRYSLVKGERIVRTVLTARLRGFFWLFAYGFIGHLLTQPIIYTSDVGLLKDP